MVSKVYIEQFQARIEHLVSNSEFEMAIDELYGLVKEKKVLGHLKREIIVLKGRYKRIMREKRASLINTEDFVICQNAILIQILLISDELDDLVFSN